MFATPRCLSPPIREHTLTMSAAFFDFWTPSPFPHLVLIDTEQNSHNLLYFIFFTETLPHPPPMWTSYV